MKKIFLCFCIIVLTGCADQFGKQQPQPEAQSLMPAQSGFDQTPVVRSIKVALLLPLTGREAQLGQAMFHAAQMSLFDNAGSELELMSYDTQGNPQIAAQQAEIALGQGADIIVGPLFSSEAQTVAQVAKQRNVPVISLSNNENIAGGNLFTFGFATDDQIRKIFEVAAANHFKRVGVFVPESSYGTLLKGYIKREATRVQAEPIIVEYGLNTFNFNAQAQALHQKNVDAILIPEGGQRLTAIISSLVKNGVDTQKVKLLGTGQWDAPEVATDSVLAGGWFVASPFKRRQNFNLQYKAYYNNYPPRLATLAYDAVSLVAYLSRTANDGSPPFTRDRLVQKRGFAGIDGVFRMKPDGTVQRSLAVFEATGHGVREVSPATEKPF
jgi:ABC-type branched-subunit amino acid transport system substrate-binding protein